MAAIPAGSKPAITAINKTVTDVHYLVNATRRNIDRVSELVLRQPKRLHGFMKQHFPRMNWCNGTGHRYSVLVR
jgi:hypothetical protein